MTECDDDDGGGDKMKMCEGIKCLFIIKYEVGERLPSEGGSVRRPQQRRHVSGLLARTLRRHAIRNKLLHRRNRRPQVVRRPRQFRAATSSPPAPPMASRHRAPPPPASQLLDYGGLCPP